MLVLHHEVDEEVVHDLSNFSLVVFQSAQVLLFEPSDVKVHVFGEIPELNQLHLSNPLRRKVLNALAFHQLVDRGTLQEVEVATIAAVVHHCQ